LKDVYLNILLELTVGEKKLLQALKFFLGGKVLLHAATDFVEKNIGSNAAYGRMSSHKLSQDFIARSTFVDHLLNSAQLPFDTSKAMQDLSLLHHIPLGV
jgi:hypothetical protein